MTGTVKKNHTMYMPPKANQQHPEVTMLTPQGDFVTIDSGIAWLISLMWGSGFETQFCCEGYDWDHPEEGDEHSWAAQNYRAYILMPRTDRNFDLAVNLLQNFERFSAGSRVRWDIEFEQSESDVFGGMNRICLRFPKSDIVLLQNFILDQYY